MGKFEKSSNMTCEQAELLMVPVWAQMPGITDEQKMAFKFHLIVCPACAAEYEKTGEMMSLVKEHWGPVSEETRQLIENAGYEVLQPDGNPISSVSISAGQDDKELCFCTEITEKRGRYKLFARIAAVAACLLFGILAWMILPNHMPQQPLSQDFGSTGAKSSIKIELLKPAGNITLDAGQVISAHKELKTLLINGKHRMVMNAGTSLSVEPVTANSQLGCLVKLDSGQIYTHVQNDGNPFMVDTAHGRAVIKGTVFDIRTGPDKMELSVVSGSVQLESEKGSVEVKKGYQSFVIAGVKPTKPVVANIPRIIQWAGHSTMTEIASLAISAKVVSDVPGLLFVSPPYNDPQGIDFDIWMKQHRNWFEREFPWTKRLQRLLADGIEVDTFDLLIASADLWRFAWPGYSQQRILAEDQEFIQKVADRYGIDFNALVSGETLIQAERNSNIEAFEKWLGTLNTEKSNKIIDSIHAATFLVNTRALAWYAIETDKVQVQDKQECLNLLAEQVRCASSCLESLKKLILSDKKESVCLTSKHEDSIEKIREDVSAMLEIEKEIRGYGISSP